MDLGLSEAVVVTGYIFAQENPENAPYSPHARSGRLFRAFHWIDLQVYEYTGTSSLVFMRVLECRRGIVVLPYRNAP